ncbi:DUF4062 domain-containing protein [Oceaniserpentilla sp. 4NH20-0058]|uniref:DUF4062 domain-containing protein n=1 Tax=Oceaniserpentilla sp. 4NH20-0058 TaxID=3127660 RepID=UPI00334203F8
MSQNTQPMVYICADPDDSGESLYTIIKVVLQLGGIPVHLNFTPNSGDYDWPLASKTIDKSDLFILLVGDSYGAISPTSESYIHREAVYAKSKNKNIIALLKNAELKEMPSQDVQRLRALHRLTMSGTFKYWNHKEDLLLICRQVLRDLLKPQISSDKTKLTSDRDVHIPLHEAIADTLFDMQSYEMRFTGKVFAHGNCQEIPRTISLTWDMAFLNIGVMMTAPVSEDRMRSALESFIEDQYRDDFMNEVPDSHALSNVRCNDMEFQRLKAFLKGAGVIENVATESSGLRSYWQLTQVGENRLQKLLIPN